MNKKTVENIEVKDKKVLVRCDFNVPQDENGKITDNRRIVSALPTIKYLMENGAKVILCSHLGRPKGEFKEKYSLKPVAEELSNLLGINIGGVYLPKKNKIIILKCLKKDVIDHELFHMASTIYDEKRKGEIT